MKVKIVLRAAALACVGLLVQGCGITENLQYFTPEETIEYKPDAHIPEVPDDTDTNEDDEAAQEEVSQVYYGYHKLDKDKQVVYLEMLDALEEMQEDVELSTTDKSVLDVVFTCVMNDHPELFYVTGYKYTEYSLGDAVTGITFSGTYSMDESQVDRTKLLLDAKINGCLRNAPDSSDEYLIAKYLYEWVINNTEYDKDVDNNQNICSVFLQGRSVCQGYAKALQYMLQLSGVECFMVTGFTGGERHAWNVANINGDYYYLDPTWGDASYSYSGDSDSIYEFAPSINYDYFLVTTDELTRTHSIEQVVELPECDVIYDNYFVREGLYFTRYDDEKLENIFKSDVSRQAGYVTIKCSEDAYDDVLSQLIDSQKVFDFIDVQGASIAYTSNAQLKTISFWNIY